MSFPKFGLIQRVDCLRESLKYAWNTTTVKQAILRHGWCTRFCQKKCMFEVQKSCQMEPHEFCGKNCRHHCFHIGNERVSFDVSKPFTTGFSKLN